MIMYLHHPPPSCFRMSSSDEPIFVDEEGDEVHSPGDSDGPEAPAAKKRKKREARDNSKRGCKMTVERRMAQHQMAYPRL